MNTDQPKPHPFNVPAFHPGKIIEGETQFYLWSWHPRYPYWSRSCWHSETVKEVLSNLPRLSCYHNKVIRHDSNGFTEVMDIPCENLSIWRVHANQMKPEQIEAVNKASAEINARAKQWNRRAPENRELREALEGMLDELVWTRRTHQYGSELVCAVCECNVSKAEPHSDTCIVGRADAAFDAIAQQPEEKPGQAGEDSKRLDWLENAKERVYPFANKWTATSGGEKRCNDAPTIREAIDAARATQEKGAA